jgi:hypothetical protein
MKEARGRAGERRGGNQKTRERLFFLFFFSFALCPVRAAAAAN